MSDKELKNTFTGNTLAKINYLIKNPDATVRIVEDDWHLMLLHNFAIKVNNQLRNIQGVNIGLGVYRIKLLPPEWDSMTFGNIELDKGTTWIKNGTGLVLKECQCKN